MLFLKLKRKGSNFEMVRKWEGEMGKWEGVREREIGKGDGDRALGRKGGGAKGRGVYFSPFCLVLK